MFPQNTDNWIRFRATPQPKVRVLAFSFAGGAAQAFRPFALGLGAHVELCALQLPGRWNRIKEAPFSRMPPLIDDITRSIEPLLDVPTVFFGYSLGALVAFELAHRLRERGLPMPKRLLLASRASPNLKPSVRLSDLPDAEFVREIDLRYGGIPEVVKKDAELLAMLLPALRADMQVYEHYECAARPALALPTNLWFGSEDRGVNEATLSAWDAYVSPVETTVFAGGHFFAFPPKPEHVQKLIALVDLEG